MQFISFLSLAFILSVAPSAYSKEKRDGVIYDEYGLTLKLGEKPVVDEERWWFDKESSSYYLYAHDSMEPKARLKVGDKYKFNEYNPRVYNMEPTKVDFDKKGNVVSVHEGKKIYTNNLIYTRFSDTPIITTSLCNELKAKKFFDLSSKCGRYEADFISVYNSFLSNDDVIKDVANTLNLSTSVVRITLEDASQPGRKKTFNSESTYSVEGSCEDLERYSKAK